MERGIDLDSFEYRKQVWENEYRSRKGLPSSNTYNPSTSLRFFLEEYPNISKELAIDIGCGNGRNSIYLAEKGFKKVIGFDISTEAIGQANSIIDEKGLVKNIKLYSKDAMEGIDAEDNSADLVIDMMTLHSLTKEARDNLISDSIRVMKSRGYYLLFTINASSKSSQELIKRYPGPEINSYRFGVDSDIITEKVFTKEELINIFKPLKLVSYKEIVSTTKVYKGHYNRVYCNVLFQKI